MEDETLGGAKVVVVADKTKVNAEDQPKELQVQTKSSNQAKETNGEDHD
jgi:hypothetical protein